VKRCMDGKCGKNGRLGGRNLSPDPITAYEVVLNL